MNVLEEKFNLLDIYFFQLSLRLLDQSYQKKVKLVKSILNYLERKPEKFDDLAFTLLEDSCFFTDNQGEKINGPQTIL